jgi:hypothetical protein
MKYVSPQISSIPSILVSGSLIDGMLLVRVIGGGGVMMMILPHQDVFKKAS